MNPTRHYTVPAQTHGRVLVQDAADLPSGRLLITFHGYKQNADDALEAARRIPGVAEKWRVVAVQGLHRFYASGERVVASWMTRQDRDEAIADNVAYVNRVVEEELKRMPGVGLQPSLVYLGFSQGAAMAYRAAVLGSRAARGIIALAGDIPPELKNAAADRQVWPPVLIGVGTTETFYTPDKVSADAAFLVSQGVKFDVCQFTGGHEWTDEFRAAAGRWLEALA